MIAYVQRLEILSCVTDPMVLGEISFYRTLDRLEVKAQEDHGDGEGSQGTS